MDVGLPDLAVRSPWRESFLGCMATMSLSSTGRGEAADEREIRSNTALTALYHLAHGQHK